MSLPPAITSSSIFSNCGNYRYSFAYQWDPQLPQVLFIGLNPTDHDPVTLNPTLRRCIGFANHWGYGGVNMVNLFAYLAITPDELKQARKPIGADNDQWLNKLSNKAELVIGAWGNSGDYLQRATAVRQMIPTMHCLRYNKSGHPAHPLYLPKHLTPIAMPQLD